MPNAKAYEAVAALLAVTFLIAACDGAPSVRRGVRSSASSTQRGAQSPAAHVVRQTVRPPTHTSFPWPAWLTSAQRKAISRAPHPYLHRLCPREQIAAAWARRARIGPHHVIVAQAQCSSGTSGTPLETAVYGRRDAQLRQLYRLDSGREINRPHYGIGSLSISVHHRRAVVRYGGYTRQDPMCCPTRLYHRVFRLWWTHATRGPLIRDN